MQRFVGEPPVERLVAAVAGGNRVLRLARRLAGRADDADVEMVVVAPIGTHLVHPRFALVRLAQRLLDRRVDEDALDLGLLRRGLDDPRLTSAPMRGVDREPVGPHHVDGGHLFALGAVESMIWRRRQPHVGVEADLVRSVAGQHRPAARLRNVADQNARPDAFLRRLA